MNVLKVVRIIGILDRIFKKKEPSQVERFEVMGGSPAIFSNGYSNAYESDIYRSAIDSIARNVAKLKGRHVVAIGEQRKDGDANINRLLQSKPNQYMTAYDLLYKLTTHLYLHNDAFCLLDKDNRGNLRAIYPLQSNNMEFMSDDLGELYCKFNFNNGKTSIFRYQDVIHLRRHFNSNDLLGDSNTAIQGALNLASTQAEGIEQSIKAGATIRGILKYTTVVSPEKLKQEKDIFVKDYLSVANSGGIVAVDQKAEYTPLESKPINIDEKQLQAIKFKIYEYLGITENIVNSSYTEEEYDSFYNGVIEPLSIQLSLEITNKVFTEREQSFGNSIVFEPRTQFTSKKTITALLKELVPMGIVSVNDALTMLNLPTMEVDKRLQTLNIVNSEIVDDYQMEKKIKKAGGTDEKQGIQNSNDSE